MKIKLLFFLMFVMSLYLPRSVFCGNLIVKHNGTMVYSVSQTGLISFAQGVQELSTTPVGTSGFKLSRGITNMLWTAGSDQVNIKGQFIEPVADTTNWIMFRNGGTGKRGAVTDEGDIPQAGGEPNLVTEDMYIDNHIIQKDYSNGSHVEYCNFFDGRVEYLKESGHIAEKKIFYNKDHLGSTRMAVDGDGKAIEVVSYDAYGAILKDDIVAGMEIPTKNKFSGKEFDQNGPPFCQIDLNLNISNFISYPSGSANSTSLTIYFDDGDEKTFICEGNSSYRQMVLQKTLQYPIKKTIIGLYLKTVNVDPDDPIDPQIDYGVGGVICPLNLNVDIGGHITISLNEDAQLSTLLQRGGGCTNEYFHPATNTNVSIKGMRLDYFGSRYFDPEIAIWTSNDPEDQFWSPYGFSPYGVNTMESDGECAWAIAGLASAGADVACQIAEAKIAGKDVNISMSSVAISFAAGCAGVGVISKISKAAKLLSLSKLATNAAKSAVEVAIDATSNAASQVAQQIDEGKEKQEINVQNLLMDVLAAKAFGKFAEVAAKHTSKTRQFEQLSKTLERILKNNPGKKNVAKDILKNEIEEEEYIAQWASAAGSSGQAATRTIVAVVKKNDSKNSSPNNVSQHSSSAASNGASSIDNTRTSTSSTNAASAAQTTPTTTTSSSNAEAKHSSVSTEAEDADGACHEMSNEGSQSDHDPGE